jgi:hypothetical protein
MQFGQVLGADGSPIAHLIITRLLESGLEARAIFGRERIVRGAKVRFEGQRR